MREVEDLRARLRSGCNISFADRLCVIAGPDTAAHSTSDPERMTMSSPTEALNVIALFDKYRAEDLLNEGTQNFLDHASVETYSEEISTCLDHPEFPHHLELIEHFRAEINGALVSRDSPALAAVKLNLAADRWEEGSCHLWDRATPIDAEDSTIDTLRISDSGHGEIVVAAATRLVFQHHNMSCELASVLRSVEVALAMEECCIDPSSIEPRMYYNAIVARPLTGDATERLASRLVALGWRVETVK